MQISRASLRISCLIGAFTVLSATVGAQAMRPRFVERPGNMEFSGQMIAKPLSNAASRSTAISAMGPHIIRHITETDEYLLRIPNGLNENSFSDNLIQTGAFKYVEPDWICYPAFTPNDPELGASWQHTVMESTLAWDVTFGNPNIILAFTDTGINLTHPDLAPNRVPGYNAPNNLAETLGGQVNDINGHGTFVAGCGAAIGNNGIGVAGICPSAKIMMVRVSNLSGGGAPISEITEGARWAADNGASVVSSSYSGVSSSTVSTTGDYIRGLGKIYLYAAGNDGATLNFDYPNVIIVGATDAGDNLSGFTARGPAVDVYAPGSSVRSTNNSGGYSNGSGTSFSTPIANGLCGLIWSANPGLTASQVETVLSHGCQDFLPLGNDDLNAWGRTNSQRSVNLGRPGMVRLVGNTIYERVPANLSSVYARTHALVRPFLGVPGQLTSIASSSEQSGITGAYSSLVNGLLLGGIQSAGGAEPGGGWSWIDGTPWTYTNWNAGEPNDGNGNEDALQFANAAGRWNDLDESSTAGTGFLMEYPTAPTALNANIDLGDFPADSTMPVTVAFTWFGQSMPSWNTTGGISATTSLLRGPVEMLISSTHWLKRRVTLNFGTAAINLNAFLINGDVDMDNEIGPSDFGLLSTAFGSVPGDSNWNANADLDGDGEVGPSDFGILSANFGEVGD